MSRKASTDDKTRLGRSQEGRPRGRRSLSTLWPSVPRSSSPLVRATAPHPRSQDYHKQRYERMPIFLTTAWAWALKNPKLVAIVGAVVIVGSLWTGLNYYRDKADKASDVIAGQREVIKSVDRHAAVQTQIHSKVEQQSEILRKLPDAQTPIDPARRDQLRRSIECVRNHKPAATCSVPPALPAR